MIGYADNHPEDTYRLYNPATGYVSLSRDVRWTDWNPLTQNDAMEHYDLMLPIIPDEPMNPIEDNDSDDEPPPCTPPSPE